MVHVKCDDSVRRSAHALFLCSCDILSYLDVDVSGNNNNSDYSQLDSKSYQWFGATVRSSGEDGVIVVSLQVSFLILNDLSTHFMFCAWVIEPRYQIVRLISSLLLCEKGNLSLHRGWLKRGIIVSNGVQTQMYINFRGSPLYMVQYFMRHKLLTIYFLVP